MKFAIKSIVAAAAFVAVGVASAQSVTVNTGDTYNGLTLNSGSGTLTFSKSLIGAINSAGADVEDVSPAKGTYGLNAKGTAYTSIAIAAPIGSITINSSTNAVTDAYTSGGALITTVDDGFTNTGGSLQITNIHANLSNNTVYVTLTGANGVGTVNNLALWNFSSISGGTTVAAGTTTTTLSGLTFVGGTSGSSAVAFNDFSTSLGLTDTGKTALAGVTDFGSITSTIVASAATTTPAVPEPGTYGLMALGLVGISLVARRRAK